jgi:predicted O-methyltransferase YrrM
MRFVTRWTDLPGLDVPLPEQIMEVLPRDSSIYPISPDLGSLLARLVLSGVIRSVLELGAGTSSVVIAQALRLAGGGRLTSIEQDPSWCRERWAMVTATPTIDAHLEVALPVFRMLGPFPCHLYATAQRTVVERGPYDLVLVDAPQRYYGRDGALPLVAGSLRCGALIVLDDAGRIWERAVIRRWLQTYVGLELIAFDPEFGRQGVAILRVTHLLSERTSVRPWVSGMAQASVGLMARTARTMRGWVPQFPLPSGAPRAG